MKKNFMSLLRMLPVIFLLLVTVTSCKDDTEPALLEKSLIEGTFQPSIGKFMLDGEDYSENGVTLQFASSTDYVGKYDLKIFGVIPYSGAYIETRVDAVPTANEITFSNSDRNSDPLQIRGTFRPYKNGDGYWLEANCEYKQINKVLTEHSFVLNFTKSFYSPDHYYTDEIEIGGVTYKMDDLLVDFYSQMGKIYAKEDSCVQFKFNTDCTLDLITEKSKNGILVNDSIMKIKCWYLSANAVLEFTQKQALEFMTKWVGTYGNGNENYLFTQYANTDRYALVFEMYALGGFEEKKRVFFRLQNEFRSRFLHLFMKNREISKLSKIEQQKMNAAYLFMYNSDRYDVPPYLYMESSYDKGTLR